uniref:Sec-independent protein translocase protein TatC n=1 Tax=uncultured Thiotrichaceae bacterium TaxID=298394 RepID=A0A6S6UKG2_9GAMM|nr:MAG: Twin-arginine translocation protein TatC [uncultured Thiotrichaceae bacterium]
MSDQAPGTEQELGFLAHLYELRDRLLRIVLVVGILFLVLMPFAQDLYNWLAYPLASQMPDGEKLVSIKPAGPFLVPFKLALLAAFLIALPFVLFQIWSFVAPGLYKHEKRLAIPMLISSTLLFYCGIAFAYFVLLPLVFSILPQFTPEVANYMPDIGHYMDFVMTLFVAFGIGFEMPVATILLIATGMATRESLAKKRPYVVVGAFIVGMLLTPPDVISQLLLAIPMWLLFEVGLLASVLFKKQIETANKEKETREQAERDAEDAEYAQATSNSSVAPVESPFEAAKAAGAAGAAAAGTADADTAQEDALLWEDDKYSYAEEVNPDELQFEETDEYRPLTDEEMDAELARIEAEEAEMDIEDDDTKLAEEPEASDSDDSGKPKA